MNDITVCRHWDMASHVPHIERCSARSDGPCVCSCYGLLENCTQIRARQARAWAEARPVSLVVRLARKCGYE